VIEEYVLLMSICQLLLHLS